MITKTCLPLLNSNPVSNIRIRFQLLLSSVAATSGIMLYEFFNIPFGEAFLPAVFISATVHIAYFLYFGHLKFYHFFILSILNTIIMGAIIHSTGGILSPFTIVFAIILVSNISFGLSTSFDLPIVACVYSTVILLEYFGIIAQPMLSAADIYRANTGTIIIFILSILLFILLSGYLEKIIIKNLESQITLERDRNDKYKEKFNEMNSTYHIGFMMSQILHELCNPLTILYGFLTLVKESDELSNTLREDMNSIYKEVERLNTMVLKLKNFIKPGDGVHCSFELNETINAVISILKMNEKINKIKFVVKNCDQTICNAWGCGDEIQQVFFNLLKNSAEAVCEKNSPLEAKIIEIKVDNEDQVYNVTIRDNGKGMTNQQIKSLSDNFFSTKKEGWGLGMGIVKCILDSHQSKLEVRSELGVGTEISFKLSNHEFV